MHPRSTLLALLVATLAACATPKAPESMQPRPAPATLAHSPVLPNQELSEEVLYQYLVGEIAAQRGDAQLAAEAFADLAKKTRDPRIAQRATQHALYAKSERQTLEAAKTWLEVDPKSPQAQQAVAALLLSQGSFAEAKPRLEAIIAADENPGKRLLQLTGLFIKQSNKKEAFELIRALAAPYPNSVEAHFAVAQVGMAAGETDQTLEHLKQARKLQPEWEPAAIMEGQLLLRTSPAKALEFYKQFLASHPKSKDVRLAYAKALATEKNYAAARVQFEQIVKEAPNNPDISVAMGVLSLQLDDVDTAENYLKQGLILGYKEEDLIRLYLGQISEKRKQLDEAAAWYSSVDEGEYYLTAQTHYADILGKQGKVDQARKVLQTARVRNNQERVQLVLAEARLLREAKQFKDVYEVLSRALEKFPDAPDLLYERGLAADKLNRLAIAEQDLRKLIQLKPDYAHAYNALGYTLADRTDRLHEALDLIKQALKLSPEEPAIMDSMGWVQYRLGDYSEALVYLKKAYAKQADPEIAAHLAEVLWVNGNKTEAEKIWEASLKDNPDNEALLEVVRRLKNQ